VKVSEIGTVCIGLSLLVVLVTVLCETCHVVMLEIVNVYAKH
jgi:hypothetical protein